jgi:hypothetical protein
VINELYHEEPLLSRIASHLAVRAPSLVYRGEPAKGVPPTRHVYDTMLAFNQVREKSPMGWTIFEVKYLELQSSQGNLVARVVMDLPNTVHREQLAELICQGFCTGSVISRRRLRRELDVDRATSGQYYENVRRVLYWLRVTEQEFAELVRVGL